MENKIGYIVEIHSGQITPKGVTNETQTFEKGELLKARSQALEFASNALVDIEMEAAEENFSFSVDAYFLNQDKSYKIFGSDLELVIPGLIEEAKYFLENGLIAQNDLSKVYLNKKTHKEDPGNPQCVFSEEDLKNWPSFEYDECLVLTHDLDIITESF